MMLLTYFITIIKQDFKLFNLLLKYDLKSTLPNDILNKITQYNLFVVISLFTL